MKKFLKGPLGKGNPFGKRKTFLCQNLRHPEIPFRVIKGLLALTFKGWKRPSLRPNWEGLEEGLPNQKEVPLPGPWVLIPEPQGNLMPKTFR